MGKPLFEIAGKLRSVLENHPARQSNLPQVRIVPQGEDKTAAVRHFGFIADEQPGSLRFEESGHPAEGNFFEARLPIVLFVPENRWEDLTLADLQILENGLTALLQSLKDQPDEVFITIPLPPLSPK